MDEADLGGRRLEWRSPCTAVRTASSSASTVGGASAAPADRPQDKKYTIYLSNGLIGNDWLQQMQRSPRWRSTKPPLAGRVDLHIETVDEHGAGADQLAQQHHRAPSRTRSSSMPPRRRRSTRPSKRACAEGIVVISFSAVVTAPCAPTRSIPTGSTSTTTSRSGSPTCSAARARSSSTGACRARRSRRPRTRRSSTVLASSRASRSSADTRPNYALGDEQAGVASLLAANPQIDGILTAGYGTGAIQALKDAGRPLVPIVMFAYNGSATACAPRPSRVSSASSTPIRRISRRTPSSWPSTSSTAAPAGQDDH